MGVTGMGKGLFRGVWGIDKGEVGFGVPVESACYGG